MGISLLITRISHEHQLRCASICLTHASSTRAAAVWNTAEARQLNEGSVCWGVLGGFGGLGLRLEVLGFRV